MENTDKFIGIGDRVRITSIMPRMDGIKPASGKTGIVCKRDTHSQMVSVLWDDGSAFRYHVDNLENMGPRVRNSGFTPTTKVLVREPDSSMELREVELRLETVVYNNLTKQFEIYLGEGYHSFPWVRTERWVAT